VIKFSFSFQKVEEAPVKILSEQELNSLGAKLLKAEMLGNNDLANKLKAELEAARSARQQHLDDLKSKGEETVEEVVVLTRTDGRGMTRPGKSHRNLFVFFFLPSLSVLICASLDWTKIHVNFLINKGTQ